jgi:two-component system sensor histidine kinase KdpD
VNLKLPADLPIVLLDGTLMEQALINILENALKYSPPASPVDISAEGAEGAVLLVVADRGPGIAPGDEQRVFEKFYRAPGTQGSGTGLGLAIAQAIVVGHGGRIWCENRVDGGAAIHVALPVDRTAAILDADDG